MSTQYTGHVTCKIYDPTHWIHGPRPPGKSKPMKTFETTHTHSNPTPTEVAAAAKVKPQPMKLTILRALAIAPDGMSPDRFAAIYGGLINTVRRRFVDLWKEGKIMKNPNSRTEENSHGNYCITWVLGEDPSLSEQKVTSKEDRLKECLFHLNSIIKLNCKPSSMPYSDWQWVYTADKLLS